MVLVLIGELSQARVVLIFRGVELPMSEFEEEVKKAEKELEESLVPLNDPDRGENLDEESPVLFPT